jgi:hypothetical protein
VRLPVKEMFFFDHGGIVHYEIAPEGQTVNQDFYQPVLRHLPDVVQRKQPEMWIMGSCLLHYDNSLAHTVLSIRQLLVKH